MSRDEIQTVAVIGAGHIGFGWAHVFCRAGLTTRLYDVSREALRHGCDELAKGLDLFVRHGLLQEAERQRALDCVQAPTDLEEALDGVEYVQESVPEKLELKRSVFEEIDRRTPPETIIASSASQIPMTDIAIRTAYPERCVVAHPCNPPHIVPLVEIVAGQKTDPEVARRTRAFMEQVGQSPITLNKEICGFALNRLQFALVREAFYLAREEVASIADIDRCLCEGVGLRWPFIGPFMTEELNSKDIVDGLTKDIDENEELWAALGDFRRYDEHDIRKAAEGVRQIMGSVSHDDALAWRDSMVLKLRALKDRERLLYWGGPSDAGRRGGRLP
jgi:3-hydroxyacyl-CoA dehydrogenase